MLKRYSPTPFGLMRHSTEKSTSTMFSSPVSIRLSSGTSRTVCRGAIVDDAHADVDLADLQRLRRQRGLDRIWQMIVEARLDLADFLAEAEHDANLVGLDPEEAGHPPQHDGAKREQAKPRPPMLPPGRTLRNLSWLRRSKSSRSGGVGPDDCGPPPQGPLPPPDPQGPPP